MSLGTTEEFNQEQLLITKIFLQKIKFSAPKPSYKILSESKESQSLYEQIDYKISSSMSFNKYNIPDWINVSLHAYNYKKNKKIIFMHIENNYTQKLLPKKVIIYSHENGTDLIRLLPFLIDLSVQNKCNIISYDYRGFGCSSSKSNDINFLKSYEYTMDYALNYLNYKIDNILLIGRDIGALHSIIIASRHKYNMCKGLILISPFFNEKIIDINNLKNIFCPTLLIKERSENNENNKEDNTVELYRKINNEREWFIKLKKNSENNTNLKISNNEDILLSHRRKFINFIREYIQTNNEDKNIYSISRKSTIAETYDNPEICFDYSDIRNDDNINNKNNIKRNYMKEFKEEDDNINYNNDDDY